MGTNSNATNYFSPTKWVVSTVSGEGTHTTIASALTSATSGDTIFIMPGTYTENITLKAGVDIVSYVADVFTPNVTIIGKATFSTTGTVSLSGIRLQTNSDFFLTMTGTNVTAVNLVNCYLNCSNNTGINYAVTNTSASLIIFCCAGNCGSTGTLFTSSSNGTFRITNSTIDNDGNSTTASTASANFVNTIFFASNFKFPFTTTSAGRYNFAQSRLECQDINTTPLTTSGTGVCTVFNCIVNGGSASALVIGSGTLINAASNTIYSTATNVFTGAGSVATGGNTCVQHSANNVSTTTHLTVI